MEDQDGVLGLPEGIIAHIYSFLTIKEAARTSILARRWKYIWTIYTHRLDFDLQVLLNLDLHEKVYFEISEIFPTYPRYVKWVDHVLKSFQDQSINEFRIHCGYHYIYYNTRDNIYIRLRDCVNRWVKFALEKGVKRLEMDLTYSHLMTHNINRFLEIYPFPLQLCIDNSSFLRSLKDLSLTYVDVSEEALEYVLSKCYLLEKLSDTCSLCLVNLKVSSLSLKTLEIVRCINLEHLEVVDSANLVVFSCSFGPKLKSYFMRNVPCVKELCFGGLSAQNYIAAELLVHMPQLESLKYLTGHMRVLQEVIPFPNNFPVKFKKLKHLELIAVLGRVSSLHFTALLKACPSLYSLKVEMVSGASMERELKKAVKEDSYECLELVELVGSPLSTNILEFIFHLVENAENLKKISIDPLPTYIFDLQTGNYIQMDEQVVRSRAMEEIAQKLPPRIEFALLEFSYLYSASVLTLPVYELY